MGAGVECARGRGGATIDKRYGKSFGRTARTIGAFKYHRDSFSERIKIAFYENAVADTKAWPRSFYRLPLNDKSRLARRGPE
jgi:hypothetical protein